MRFITIVFLFLAITVQAASTGFMKGHLEIIFGHEVELADQSQSQPGESNYADYPLIILQNKKEVARVTADKNGNYEISLAPGDYILDVRGRATGHLRATPQHFTITSNQTIRVDMSIDTGVR